MSPDIQSKRTRWLVVNKVFSLALRNLKRYSRDKGALFFSFLSVFIVVGLYVFFLADMQIDTIQAAIGDVDVDQVIYSWTLAGVLCIPAVSVPLILLTFKVEDVVEGVQDDLYVTPVNRTYIMFGYVLAALVAGLVMTFLTLVLGELFIYLKGGTLLSLSATLKVMGIISLTILAFSGLSFFVVLPLKSNSAVMVVNTILNTLIGFFAGLYVPIGFLSEGIGNVIKGFPLAHAAALLRQTIMESAMEQAFQSAPAEAVTALRADYGVDITIGNHLFSTGEMLLMLAALCLIFYTGSALLVTKSKRV